MKLLRNAILVILLLAIAYFMYRVTREDYGSKPKAVYKDSVFAFPGLVGPSKASFIEPMQRSSWKKYATGENYGIAVLLTDTSVNSNWLGLVHSFKSFGIPFRFNTNIDEALKNEVVYVYPSVNSLKSAAIQKLIQFLKRGGTLIAQCVDGDMNEAFGFKKSVSSTSNFKIRITDLNNPLLKEFTDSKEREISIANEKLFKQSEGTYEYSGLAGSPLMAYPDGNTFLTEMNYAGGGKAFAFGIDLGYFALTCQNARSMEAYRTYVNSYEPSLDVLMRIVKNIYTSSSKAAVTLGTVPENKALTVCITHDIDYSKSMSNAVIYAKMEHSKNVTATYFTQTKYIKDWNEDAFFNDSAIVSLKTLDSLKMEVASHSVSHSRVYDSFPDGTGTEEYPSYHPIVKEQYVTVNGTVIGELRVSKFLLEHFITDQPIISFRPGHLSLPFSLPQCLEASGYKYSSDVTANAVLTHLPYQLNYNRDYGEELPLFEFPITIEDEEPPHMDKRLDSALTVARKISKYGGLMCVLIHPNVIDYKYRFEVGLLDSLKNQAYACSMREYADWWGARNNVTYSVNKNPTGYELHINTPVNVSNLTFFVPHGWVANASGQKITQTGNAVLVENVTNGMVVKFTAK